MSPALRQCAELYRELIKVNIDPVRADDLELWQIAALQEGGDEESTETQEQRLIRMRYEAAAEGRELDPEEVFIGMSESQVNRLVTDLSSP